MYQQIILCISRRWTMTRPRRPSAPDDWSLAGSNGGSRPALANKEDGDHRPLRGSVMGSRALTTICTAFSSATGVDREPPTVVISRRGVIQRSKHSFPLRLRFSAHFSRYVSSL
jgi:hypothetical protein